MKNIHFTLSFALLILVVSIPTTAMCIDLRPGDLIVALSDKRGTILKVDPVTGDRVLISKWGERGSGPQIRSPRSILIEASGDFLVADWNPQGVFRVGLRWPKLYEIVEKLPKTAWKRLRRRVKQGQQKLFDDAKCFFYITNDRAASSEEIVFEANDRCNQENLIAQQKSGVRSLTAPVDTLLSNGAYRVMASLAWSLKAWSALLLPESGRWKEKHGAGKRTLLRC